MMTEAMELNGMMIEHRSIGADYVLLRVGFKAGLEPDIPDVHYWQAFAIGQMMHRLWVVPKTTDEVHHDFRAGCIVDAGRMNWPACEDSCGCSV